MPARHRFAGFGGGFLAGFTVPGLLLIGLSKLVRMF